MVRESQRLAEKGKREQSRDDSGLLLLLADNRMWLQRQKEKKFQFNWDESVS